MMAMIGQAMIGGRFEEEASRKESFDYMNFVMLCLVSIFTALVVSFVYKMKLK